MKKNNLLIVDDVTQNLLLLKELLQEEDMQIWLATDGHQALELVNQISFDLILLDIQMPIMDGYETCSLLKKNVESSHIPIIFITGINDDESIIKGFNCGAVDYLSKPFNNLELKTRVKSQLELKKLRDDLEEQVKSRTAELDEALAAIKVNNKAKELFLTNISHEIHTPLNGVLNMASLLQNSELNNEQKQLSESLYHSAKYLKSVIDDIFEYTLVNTGDSKVEESIFNLREVIGKCTEVYKFRCEEKGILFKVNYLQPLPGNIVADQNKLTRIITLLLSNSMKFTLSGKIELNVSYILGNETLQIEVADTGIGIAQKDQDKIFEKFYQVNTSAQKPYTGTGIGLALCKELVNLLGGKIELKSTLHNGSSFSFGINVKTAPEKIATIPPFKQVEGNQILLVEDNKTNQLVIKKLLSPYNLNIDVAPNGKVAIEMLQKKSYNLVLMDLMMPVMDGFEATKAIRAEEKWKNLPIIAQTACWLDNTKDKFREAGMNDYLEKPINVDKLVQVMGKFIKISKKPSP